MVFDKNGFLALDGKAERMIGLHGGANGAVNVSLHVAGARSGAYVSLLLSADEARVLAERLIMLSGLGRITLTGDGISLAE